MSDPLASRGFSIRENAKQDHYKDVSHDTHKTVDGEHGRIETRTCATIGDVDWFEEKSKWAKLTTLGMVESEREIRGQVTRETRCYIFSLPNDDKRFGEAARGHWGVENSLHWRLDIAFRKDDCRLRLGHEAHNMAVIRRFAIGLAKQDPSCKIGVKASRKRAGWGDDYLLTLLKL